MDEQLEKYRFGITLELDASCYQFGTDEDPPRFVNSICHYTVAWFQQTGFTLRLIEKNSYIVSGVLDVEIIRNQIRGYYFATQNKCAPFL